MEEQNTREQVRRNPARSRPQAQNRKNADRKRNAPVKRKPEKKRRRRTNISTMIAVFIIFLAIYFVFTLLVYGFVMYSFHSTENNDTIYSISVVYDENELFELDTEEANNEYGLYIPFEYLAQISSFSLAGDGENMTLSMVGTENRIEFTKNSSLVVINDNPVRLSAPMLYEEDDFLIPVTLLENYISGIDVIYDDEDMICTISTELKKSDISLKILLPEPAVPPDFPDHIKYNTTADNSDDTE